MAPRAIRVLARPRRRRIARLPIGDAERRWGAPYLVIHRADLQQRARAKAATRLPNIALRLGTEVAGVGDDGDGVTVGLEARPGGDAREAGDVLIGADGLRSLMRERIGLGAADAADFLRPRRVSRHGRRAKVAPRWSAGEVTLRLGPKAHLVHYPVRGGSLVNLVAAIESGWRGERDRPPGTASPTVPRSTARSPIGRATRAR